MDTKWIKVTGTSFSKINDIINAFMDQKKINQDELIFKVPAKVIFEPENQYDPTAIKVMMFIEKANQWFKVGYIPKDEPDKTHIIESTTECRITYYKDLDNSKFEVNVSLH